MIAPSAEQLLAEWRQEVEEHGIWTSGHAIAQRMADLLASQDRALGEAQRDAEQHLARANEEIGMRHDAQIAYTQSEQKRLVLIAQLTAAQGEIAQLKGVLSRIEHTHTEMGIYPAAVRGYNDERDYEQRDGFKNGWNAAVQHFGNAVTAEVMALQDKGYVPDLLLAYDSDGGLWRERAEQAEAERERLRRSLRSIEEQASAHDGYWAAATARSALSTPARPTEEP